MTTVIGTYASSSCFIFLNSSLVMLPSPSPSRWSFSLDASKSGRGGHGGIYLPNYKLHSIRFRLIISLLLWYSQCSPHIHHSLHIDRATKQTPHAVAQQKSLVSYRWVWSSVCVRWISLYLFRSMHPKYRRPMNFRPMGWVVPILAAYFRHPV